MEKTGPRYILQYATTREVKTFHYGDDAEERAKLREDLAKLTGPTIYCVRLFREDTEAIVAALRGPELVA